MSDGNMLLAVVLAALGVFDLVISRVMQQKQPGKAPAILQIAGVLMLVLAALLALGVIRLVG